MLQWITSQPEVDWQEVSRPDAPVDDDRNAFFFKLTDRRVASTVDVLVTSGQEAFDDVRGDCCNAMGGLLRCAQGRLTDGTPCQGAAASVCDSAAAVCCVCLRTPSLLGRLGLQPVRLLRLFHQAVCTSLTGHTQVTALDLNLSIQCAMGAGAFTISKQRVDRGCRCVRTGTGTRLCARAASGCAELWCLPSTALPSATPGVSLPARRHTRHRTSNMRHAAP